MISAKHLQSACSPAALRQLCCCWGGFLFGGFTFRAALEAAKDGLLLIAALGMFVIAGMLMVKGKNPEKFTQKEKWRVHFAVLGYKSVFAVLCVSWVLWAAAADYLLYRM